MGTCTTCGNEYDKTFEIHMAGQQYTFDCFECAVHLLAPQCDHCGVKIIGHGLEAVGVFYCCDHCAEQTGVAGLKDRTSG